MDSKVKLLDWDNHNGKRYFAKSVVGEYAVIRHGSHFALVRPQDSFDGFGYPFEGPAEACKAAAQADFERRILSAITEASAELCSDCPSVGFDFERTRCLSCPRRTLTKDEQGAVA